MRYCGGKSQCHHKHPQKMCSLFTEADNGVMQLFVKEQQQLPEAKRDKPLEYALRMPLPDKLLE